MLSQTNIFTALPTLFYHLISIRESQKIIAISYHAKRLPPIWYPSKSATAKFHHSYYITIRSNYAAYL